MIRVNYFKVLLKDSLLLPYHLLINYHQLQDTIYLDDIEERENGGTPQIIQTVRAALAFWVKDYIGCHVIEKQEHTHIEKALQRLLSNQNISILGNTNARRQAILSFIIYSTSISPLASLKNGGNTDMWRETGNKRDKPLHGPFVAKLLNDLFGIQARGGCACAGPYGHSLLNLDATYSLAIRAAIQKVNIILPKSKIYEVERQYFELKFSCIFTGLCWSKTRMD